MTGVQTCALPIYETQRPNELVGLVGGDQPGVNARPESVGRTPFGQGPNPTASPNPSPWNDQGNGGPHPGNANGDPSGSGDNGGSNGGQTDQPNPSPWSDPSGPHWGGVPTGGGKVGTGG